MKTELKAPANNDGWICTDASAEQYGRKIADRTFQFREPTRWGAINLDDYPIKEQEHIINAYGYTLVEGEDKMPSLLNVREHYKESANWIIAECIFESLF